jgi:hypothetical protein
MVGFKNVHRFKIIFTPKAHKITNINIFFLKNFKSNCKRCETDKKIATILDSSAIVALNREHDYRLLRQLIAFADSVYNLHKLYIFLFTTKSNHLVYINSTSLFS